MNKRKPVNTLKATLAKQEFVRRGGFTKQGIKIKVGDDVSFRESKSRLKSDLEIRSKNKSEGTNTPESGLFVTTRTLNGISDVSKKVRMPKNRTPHRIKQKENAYSKNHSDAIAVVRVQQLNPLWEAWCKYDSQVSFSKFEREIMKFRAYKKRLNIVKSKMNTPA